MVMFPESIRIRLIIMNSSMWKQGVNHCFMMCGKLSSKQGIICLLLLIET